MLAEIGYGVLVVAFIAALYSVAAAIYGHRSRSAARWNRPGVPCCCFGR